MPDENEILMIELSTKHRLNLANEISLQMDKLGLIKFSALELGFTLPANWPCGETEITLAQLVVLAKKLNMRITITEFFMEPRKGKNAG